MLNNKRMYVQTKRPSVRRSRRHLVVQTVEDPLLLLRQKQLAMLLHQRAVEHGRPVRVLTALVATADSVAQTLTCIAAALDPLLHTHAVVVPAQRAVFELIPQRAHQLRLAQRRQACGLVRAGTFAQLFSQFGHAELVHLQWLARAASGHGSGRACTRGGNGG